MQDWLKTFHGGNQAFPAVEARFVILPITAAVTRIAVEFPSPYPLDPMDRIIGATALDRGVPLVTKDKMIRKAKALPVIW